MARPPVVNDMFLLVPEFRARVEALVDDLQRQSFRPKVFETLRTAERGEWLEARGKTRNGALSLHCYGAAADIICRRHAWSCGKKGCDFYAHLGAAAQRQGLYWGGTLFSSFVDLPHVQAVPMSAQNALRSAESVAAYVAGYLDGRKERAA